MTLEQPETMTPEQIAQASKNLKRLLKKKRQASQQTTPRPGTGTGAKVVQRRLPEPPKEPKRNVMGWEEPVGWGKGSKSR